MKARWISGIALFVIFVGGLFLGGWVILTEILAILGLSAWEFGRIYDGENQKIPLILLVVTVTALALARWFFGMNGSHRVLTFCILAGMIWSVWACEHGLPNPAQSFAVLTAGMVYFGWLGAYLISIYQLENGALKIFLTVFLTCTNDIWALFVGKAFGKHHMLPLVSPKKTWEGYFGGVAVSVLFGIALSAFVPHIKELLNVRQMVLLSLMIALLAPIGDFGESMIKRTFGVKDSSNLIPGHGGFFDRFDSMFFSLPLAYFFFELVQLGII